MLIALIDIQYKLKKKRKGFRDQDIKYKNWCKAIDKMSMRCYNEFVK